MCQCLHMFIFFGLLLYYYISLGNPPPSSNLICIELSEIWLLRHCAMTLDFWRILWHWRMEKWLMKIQLFHHRNKICLKINWNWKNVLNCNSILQYYCFTLSSILKYFDRLKKNYWPPNTSTVFYALQQILRLVCFLITFQFSHILGVIFRFHSSRFT